MNYCIWKHLKKSYQNIFTILFVVSFSFRLEKLPRKLKIHLFELSIQKRFITYILALRGTFVTFISIDVIFLAVIKKRNQKLLDPLLYSSLFITTIFEKSTVTQKKNLSAISVSSTLTNLKCRQHVKIRLVVSGRYPNL